MIRLSLLMLSALVGVVSAPLSAAQTTAMSPSAVYMELFTATKNATSFDQIAPYLNEALRNGLAPEVRGRWFSRFKETMNLTDLKVTKESIQGDMCSLTATAKRSSGKPATGKIDLLKRNGEWKFDDQFWSDAP